MIQLEIAETVAPSIDPAITSRPILETAAEETLRYASTPEGAGGTILVSDDDHLRQLNRQFLGIDEPTDVLSFQAGHVDPDTNTLYLGDVIISYPRAREQAADAGHSVRDELKLLVVHGMLHLLGYDHADPDDKEIMWAAQESILKRLND